MVYSFVKYYGLVLLFIINVSYCLGQSIGYQTADFYSRNYLPSPSVSGLGRYGAIPSDLSTGDLGLTISLGTLPVGELKYDLKLKYNSTGIRVDQIASEVGLGWNLLASGVISVNIMGNSDLHDKRINIPDRDNVNINTIPSENDFLNIIYNENVPANRRDSQPDIFTYNFYGYTGQFIFDNNLTPHSVSGNKLMKIEYDKQNDSFVFTDEYGIVFKFTEKEKSVYENYTCSFSNYENGNLMPLKDLVRKEMITAYFLTSISTANGDDKIAIYYDNEHQKYETKPSASLVFTGTWTGTDESSGNYAYYSKIDNYTKRVTRVLNCRTGEKYEFTYGLREDLDGGKYLASIKLFDGLNQSIDEWKLSYKYLESSFSKLSPNIYASKRMFLTNILNCKDNRSYYFEYNEKYAMPYRNSYSGADLWGYYNGEKNQPDQIRYMFPNTNKKIQPPTYIAPGITWDSIYPNQNYEHEIIFNDGENKDLLNPYTESYILKKVTYPTGGYEYYNYEPNTYIWLQSNNIGTEQYCGGIRIKTIEKFDINGSIKNVVKYDYSHNNKTSGTLSYYPNYAGWRCYSDGTIKCRLMVNSYSKNSINNLFGNNLLYRRVTEIHSDARVIHWFYSHYDYPNTDSPKVGTISFGNTKYLYLGEEKTVQYNTTFWGDHFARGLEYYTEIEDKKGRPIKKISRKYLLKKGNILNGFETNSIGQSKSHFTFSIYGIQTGIALLKNIDQYEYNRTNEYSAINSKVEFFYDSIYNLLQKEIFNNSDGSTRIKAYKYPFDLGGVYSIMTQKNMLNYVIEESNSNNEARSTVLNLFKLYNNKIHKEKELISNRFKGTYSIDMSLNEFKTISQINKYSSSGKIIEFVDKNGITNVVVWGYFGSYPIMHVKNASYDEVCNAFGSEAQLLLFQEKYIYVQSDFNDALIKLNKSMAFVSTYEPLIGLTNRSLPNGYSENIKYGEDNRIRERYIYNNQKNKEIITSYEYNYYNQNVER